MAYPPKQPPQEHIRLTPTAWKHIRQQSSLYGYEGRSLHTGTTHYLLALFAQNPTDPPPPDTLLNYWGDNRPSSLTMRDAFWLRKGRFPLWGLIEHGYDDDIPYERRTLHSINASHFSLLIPDLARLSIHFLIAPTRSNQTNPRARCIAVLEAIGLSYLTPLNPPPFNPHPVPPERHRRYVRQAAATRYNSQERIVF